MNKMKKIRQLLAVTILALITVVTVVIILKTIKTPRPEDVLAKLPKNIDISLQQIHFTETKNGAKQWDLTANKAELDQTGTVSHLSGVKLIVILDKSPGNVTLTSDKADYFMKTKDVTLIGHVHAVTASGMTFNSSTAQYHAARSLLSSPDRVFLSDGNVDVEGTGLEMVTTTGKARLLQEVKAHVRSTGR